MNTQNVYSLCAFRRESMFERYWDFYSAMSTTLLTECVLDYNKEISTTSKPTEKLLIEGIALFDFISSITDNSDLSQLAKARAEYLRNMLKTQLNLT